MLFNSIQYLIFLVIVLAVYYIIPLKFRYLWLLAASYYFYMQWNPKYILLLLFSTLVTFVGGLILEKQTEDTPRRFCLFFCIAANLLILFYFKYFNLLIEYINKFRNAFGKHSVQWDKSIVLPVGISFFTLQALGYLIDVYRNEIYAEHNFFRYALFISFFPQLVAGPIERSKNLLKQLSQPATPSFEDVRRGMILLLYGYFIKMVIADRASILVDTVYGKPETYTGVYIIAATFFFAIQIYCDFYGYSTIARGSAMLLGIRLMDNFNAPYFSKSIKEFWRRWHISLSTWFRDYLYIPLGGNRKGEIRKYLNILIVFMISGLWHGAALSFAVWGLLHGLYQVLESIYHKVRNVLSIRFSALPNSSGQNFSKRLMSRMITFSLVCFAWVFFRAGWLKNALTVIKSVLSGFHITIFLDGRFLSLGVPLEYMNILLASILLLAIVDYQKYLGKDVVQMFLSQDYWFRAITEVVMILVIIMYGYYGYVYDVKQFIYFQF